MQNLLELLQYDFFQNALLAALLAGISCGITGAYVVARRMVFITGGITHASFGGIGLGYLLGINPLTGAIAFALLSGLGVVHFSRKSNIRDDSVIAIVWSAGMALGIIFIHLTPGYVPNLMSYLFGNILTVSSNDLLLMAPATVATALVFFFFFNPILFIAFDEDYARTHRIPVHAVNLALTALIAVTVVINIRVVGIILALALFTLPQNTANLFSKSFRGIILLSVVFAIAGTLSGLVISYIYDIPSGATIILTLTLIYLLSRLSLLVCRKKCRRT